MTMPIKSKQHQVWQPLCEGVEIRGGYSAAYRDILTPEALRFVRELHRNFNGRRVALLAQREQRQAEIDEGKMPNFLDETREIRESEWTVAPIPADLQDRRVEITGPVERKMVINALNSGAKVFMADFEDSNTPNWENTIEGQINLRDANLGTIRYENPDNGKIYMLNEKTSTLMVRPRGWHLEEKHLWIDGQIASGSLTDFGLYFFHNVETLRAKGSAPYFYLPKIESHLEARLWNDVFVFAQNYLNVPQSTIRATVLIETILATFELHEILWELRDHSAGLNCGRWDYIFSYIKKFRNLKGFNLPDRSKVTMGVPFMSAYANLVVQTCHRRGIHGMGGMAAQIPIRGNAAANEAALERVRTDKLREVQIGHDGTWVAHPGLVPIAMDVFDANMPMPNQIERKKEDFTCTADMLVAAPEGSITEEGLRLNLNVGILYIESWLRGNGAAAIYNLMEDAATAEISRSQVWQWIRNKSKLEDGRTISYRLCLDILPEEIEKIRLYVGDESYRNGKFKKAIQLFKKLIRSKQFEEFLTLSAYEFVD